MKKIMVIILTILGLIGLATPLIGCGSGQDEALAQENQTVTVQRGNLSVEINAAGNLALSHSEDLAFELFYPEGTVEEVLAEEGDIVTEGQVLSKVDTDEWDDELEALQDKLTGAERALTAEARAQVTAERKVIDLEREVTDKESAVAQAERQVTAKELAVSQAQLDLETAEYNLNEIDEVKEAQDAIDKAESNLELAIMGLTGAFGRGLQADFTYWSNLKTKAEEELAEAQEELQEILEDKDITLSRDVALEVADKQLKVKQKQLALEDAKLDVDDARKAVDDAQYALEDAKLDVEEARHDVADAKLDVDEANKALLKAQEKLGEANSKSPLIVAPFAGFITRVNVEGGDDIMTGTVAVQLADPNKFEAEIMVSEMDIMQVKEGGEAWVQVDAMSGLTLPAKVTHIEPTATISQGVVNYKVTVEVASLETAAQEQGAQATSPEATAVPSNSQLREGLTVTISLIVAERQNVLLVPYTAITKEGGQSYVQVISSTGTTEKRAIKTGITDYQFAEVTEGLSEGEKVIIPQSTKAATTTQQQPQGGMMPIPGVGGSPPPPGG